ncbi:hypothetical protein PENTCL1PPCAC_22088, partial [Pristionchus entomophagus]
QMRSIVISSLESTRFSSEKEVIGVETVSHLGLTLIASTSTLLFVENGEVTRSVAWREMEAEEGDTVVVFGVIEGRAVCVFSSGIVSCIDCESGEMEECVLSVGGPIMGGSINPVSCLISLVLTDYTITIIDPLFDILVEGIELKTTERGMDELVTVGWGSEKTQFQGKVGKEEREKKSESRKAREDDTRGCRVEWRGDGEVFLVNYYDEEKEERECTIWNAEGQLISRILRETRMEEWSSFRPMGNIIGVASEGRGIMAERNGEARNGVIRVDQVIEGGRIKEGAWNIDASILSLEVEKRRADGTITHYLTLWTCANLDWSCKLALPFEGSIPAWSWNKERWNEMVVVSPSNDLFTLHLSLPCHSSNGIVCTMGTVSLRLTNLNRVIIPPPMAEISLPLASPSALFFSSTDLLAVSHQRIIHHYSISSPPSSILSSSLISSFPISIPPNSIITSISRVNGEYTVAFTHHSLHSLVYYDGEGKELRKSAIRSAVISIKKEADGSHSILLSDGSIDNETNRVEGPSDDQSNLVDHRFVENGMGMYTLHTSSNLFHNERLISKGVSSFTFTHPFLAWIDNTFRLHVMDTTTKEEADVRSVEKGARLVSIAPPKVILQMSRGNLETIHARFFVIRSVRSLLTAGDVNRALVHMRKHGISFTLLKEFDHFFSSSIDWLCQLQDVNLLSLVITELRSIPEYSPYCDVLSSSILYLPSSHILGLFPSLLTSLLLSKPPRAKEAFRSIVHHLPKDSSRPSTLRHWLQVCSFFMNPADTFKSSLSTYDLEFVVEVVEALSIDPNEYMHILRELNELSDLSYRAYKMDVLSEDWSSALSNLAQSHPPRLDEVKDLIKSKSLYALSLRIYGEGDEPNPLFNTIGRLALDHFSKEGKWKEASSVARVIGEYGEEMKWREKMGDVEGWMRALELNRTGEEERKSKMNEWKNTLVKHSKWEIVAALIKHMDCGWEERLEIMEKARDWKGIVREVEEEKEKKEVEKRGREIVKRRSEEIEREMKEKIMEIQRLSNRLNVVREKKRDLMMRMANGEMELEDLERCDAFSESSMASSRSNFSRSSRASTTSRRTKKIEKKKGSLKEGGEWEDAAILRVCHTHWMALRDILGESSTLISCLVSLRLFSSLSSLSSSLDHLESTLTRLSPIIWPSKMEAHHLTGPLSHIYEEGASVEGGMPSSISIDPEMNPPSPLSDKEKGWRIVL